ncbi:glycine zipper 2TM domain-containing protein [Aurantiacibacter gilvus]|uniref:17 kDa surface antigen n=1 Tax=Aurantiacibacter gilvus TaxID=3139141 RepID=A0ABU9IFD1_9SPHN
MKQTLIALAAATSLALPAVPAMAQHGPPSWAPAHGYRDQHRGDRYDTRYDRRDERRYDRRGDRREERRYRVYDDDGRYYEPRRVRRDDRVWQGRDGRYYCERENGTTGLIIGAAGGALVGRAIDTRGDRTVGTLLGAVVGGLLGREIDRGEARCR